MYIVIIYSLVINIIIKNVDLWFDKKSGCFFCNIFEK